MRELVCLRRSPKGFACQLVFSVNQKRACKFFGSSTTELWQLSVTVRSESALQLLRLRSLGSFRRSLSLTLREGLFAVVNFFVSVYCHKQKRTHNLWVPIVVGSSRARQIKKRVKAKLAHQPPPEVTDPRTPLFSQSFVSPEQFDVIIVKSQGR